MREIKFRVWSKTEKKMYSWEYIGGLNRFNSVLNDEDFEVMQFTNLKDKNGKDIYEGDILHAATVTKPFPNTSYSSGYVPIKVSDIVVVKWHDSVTGYLPFMSLQGNGEDPKECEIIGNIYENPELVK